MNNQKVMIGFFVMLVVVFAAQNMADKSKSECEALLAKPEPAAFDCAKAMEQQARAGGKTQTLTCDAMAKAAEQERKAWERCREKAR